MTVKAFPSSCSTKMKLLILLQTEMSVGQDGRPPDEMFGSLGEIESDGNDLDFDYDDGENILEVNMKNPDRKEQEMQEVLLKAMRKPMIRKQIGEVIPILRVMTPAQRLTLAALVSSQITSQNTLSEENLVQMTGMFAKKNVENTDDRHNITEHLLLPISVDIAKMFKGLGKEMSRNLRDEFYKPVDSTSGEISVGRFIEKPDFRNEPLPIRRMDEVDYDQSEEQTPTQKPVAEALKQPGKDECDFFTKSLCLEVSNYPTEAIILSLKKNQDIANTFLTDFEVDPMEESKKDPRTQINGRRLERRQDGQNEVQELAPDGGYMCPSSVKYARPKRARTTSGQWKYVVNAGDYTQTLRLEICQKPKSPCSYVTNHLNSQCTQIYNYHRLLSWDESKGLHMDIFKVPSCCSCHIQGYSTFYPPNKDFTFAEKRKEPLDGVSTLSEPQNRLLYGYLANKREISKQVSNGPNASFLPTAAKNQSYLVQAKDFYRNPVDHLIPPGPPLPLENEGVFKPYSELLYGQTKHHLEQNRQYPVQAEYRRIIHKASEGIDPLTFPPNTHLKPSLSFAPERQNIKFAKPHQHEMASDVSVETKVSDFKHFSKTSPNAPPSFPNLEIITEKTNGGAGFVAGFASNLPVGPKIHPPQFFRPEFLDNKNSPSKVSFSYATPPKPKGIENRVSTTPTPAHKSELFTSTGQKKINYNYHPIIDFFSNDSKKRQGTNPDTQYLPAGLQDWIPVLGH